MIRPPTSPTEPLLPPQTAEEAFDAAGATRGDGRPLALLDAQGRVVYATASALDAFAALSVAALAARLTGGEGPSARRLRHLAATLPIGAPSRLERLRFTVGRRTIERNLSCARITTPEGKTLLVLWAPATAPAATAHDSSPQTSVPAAPIPTVAEPAPETARRFVWSLDESGRFGETGPTLQAALGAAAPRPGETFDEAQRRVDAGNADAFAEAIGKRETFSDLVLLWPASETGFLARLSLSGAPIFGRSREFRGFRGFGVVSGREAAPAGEPEAEAAEPEFPAAAVASPPVIEAESASPPIVDAVPPPIAEEARKLTLSAPPAAESSDAEPSAAAPDEPAPEPPVADAPAASPERTAAIYVLRQTASTPVKVVPIRPVSPDTPPIDPALGSGAVELTKSEREAFREIARALVGRTPTSHYDRMPPEEPAAPPPEPPVEAAPPPPADGMSPPAAESDPIRRNAAALIDRLPVGVVVARDGRALYLNQTLLALLGYADFDAFNAADGLAAMFDGGDPPALPPGANGALTIARADGERLAVDGHVQAILWEGAPATLIALRRSAEAEMKQRLEAIERGLARNGSASQLQEMLDCATDGAVTLDSAGRILSLNGSAERLFGYAEKEVAGESVLMLLAPHSHPETTARLETLSRSDDEAPARPLAVAGRRRDGAALALALTLARIGPPDALHYCALVRDLSETREAERRLTVTRDAAIAASSAKTEYLAQVSHEIRTPLNAILGFAEVMMEERFGPIGNERYRDYLRDIHTSGKHVMSLADDLLDLAKIESGKLELEFSAVDANAVIRECVSLMQPQATRERIIMRISLLDHLPLVMVDERSLRQIMLNLMSNAVKFNEPGGQVIVSTALDGAGQAVIRVRDTGVGMNESEIGHALEPFGQVNRRGKPGAGLGLPLTKALVEANKAEFSIQSRRDHGTLIEIAFPVARAAQ